MESIRTFILLGILGIVLLSGFIIYEELQEDIQEVPYYVEVQNTLGVNTQTGALYFGSMPPQSVGTREFTITNTRRFPILVEFRVKSKEVNWLSVSANDFKLSPGESKELIAQITIPGDAEHGTYSGLLLIKTKTLFFESPTGYAVGSISTEIIGNTTLTASPPSISKSSTVGTETTQVLSLENTGNFSALEVTLSDDASWISLNETNFSQINANTTSSLLVTLNSASAGSFAGVITITPVNAPSIEVPASLAATAAAVETPVVAPPSGGGGSAATAPRVFVKPVTEKILPLQPLTQPGKFTVIIEEPLEVDIIRVEANVIQEVRNGFFKVINYLESKPKDISTPPSDKVLAYVEVESINFNTLLIDDARITFRASLGAIERAGTTPEQVALYHYLEGEWIELETELIRKTDQEAVYASRTPTFSYFAIAESGLKEPTARVKELPISIRENYELYVRYSRLSPGNLGLIKLLILNKGPRPITVESDITTPTIWSVEEHHIEKIIKPNTEEELSFSVIPHEPGVYFVKFEGSIDGDPFKKTISVTVERRILGFKPEEWKQMEQLGYLAIVLALLGVIYRQRIKLKKKYARKQKRDKARKK